MSHIDKMGKLFSRADRTIGGRRLSMKKTIIICGVLSALFTVFHIAFWWLFDWPATLGYMLPEHRMLMQTFNFCMLPLFVFFTYVYFALGDEILSTRLGRAVLLMNACIYYFRSAAELLFGNIQLGHSQFFFLLCLFMGILFTVPALKRRNL